jgi:hypothetical protein
MPPKHIARFQTLSWMSERMAIFIRVSPFFQVFFRVMRAARTPRLAEERIGEQRNPVFQQKPPGPGPPFTIEGKLDDKIRCVAKIDSDKGVFHAHYVVHIV